MHIVSVRGKFITTYLLLVVCLYSEPSPEEKLQKLHTDIKFALKVDNPVSDIYKFGSSGFFFFSMKTRLLLFIYYVFLGHRAVSTSPGRS